MAGFNTIASVEYAVEHLHVPIVVFLSHESCGAVGVAIDSVVGTTCKDLEDGDDARTTTVVPMAPLDIKVKLRSHYRKAIDVSPKDPIASSAASGGGGAQQVPRQPREGHFACGQGSQRNGRLGWNSSMQLYQG